MKKRKTSKVTATREIPLDRRISFRLQRIGTLLTVQALTILRRAGGLTLNQWRLLSFLSERDGGSVHELARLGHISKATMSRAAASLRKRGLLEAETSERDRRRVVLRPTRKGRKALEAVSPAMNARQAGLVGALTEAEREALFGILDKLEAGISRSGAQRP